MKKNKPAHQIRFGSIKASIWENETVNGAWYNVTIQRLYHQDGEWHWSDSFGRDELLLVAKVADTAHTWICAQAPKEEEPAEEI